MITQKIKNDFISHKFMEIKSFLIFSIVINFTTIIHFTTSLFTNFQFIMKLVYNIILYFNCKISFKILEKCHLRIFNRSTWQL